MHRSAFKAMRRLVAAYVPTDRRIKVVDLGSIATEQQITAGRTHRALFTDHDAEILGLDLVAGPNVDVVLPRPYGLPLRSNSVDIVISGQVFEHIPYFWATTLEIARVLKPGGRFLLTVPSRGHKHMIVDAWRFYDDGVRAMAAFSGLSVVRTHTDFPLRRPDRVFEVEHRANVEGYWGDTIGVLEKPRDYPTRRMMLVRRPIVWWANRTTPAFLASVEGSRRRKARRRSTPKPAQSA